MYALEERPEHVAIIMDGNGRWAKARGQERLHGHVAGVESIRKIIRAALGQGIKYLTLYAFSTENWGRPQAEIDGLMELLVKHTAAETPGLKAQGVRIRFIGDVEAMSDAVRRAKAYAEEETAENTKLTLIIAINYSARWEITRAVQLLARAAVEGAVVPEEITAKMVDERLATSEFPDPDLIIRTSGEYRLSNFLLWQAAYSEFYFTDVLWPDFGEADFSRALDVFAKRDRRYGTLK